MKFGSCGECVWVPAAFYTNNDETKRHHVYGGVNLIPNLTQGKLPQTILKSGRFVPGGTGGPGNYGQSPTSGALRARYIVRMGIDGKVWDHMSCVNRATGVSSQVFTGYGSTNPNNSTKYMREPGQGPVHHYTYHPNTNQPTRAPFHVTHPWSDY